MRYTIISKIVYKFKVSSDVINLMIMMIMKLSLDELEVESYALQVSESELSEVKGGTTWVCVDFGVAAANLISLTMELILCTSMGVTNIYRIFNDR